MKENNERLLNKKYCSVVHKIAMIIPIHFLTPLFQYFGLLNLSNKRFISLDIKGVSIDHYLTSNFTPEFIPTREKILHLENA